MAAVDLAPLFEPLQIGPLVLRNRFVLPAMQVGFVEGSGPSQRMIDYLRARAEGGAAPRAGLDRGRPQDHRRLTVT
jgi:2,4-dienoyl-CoA reductase-like NADH-dependent reductase (Old Yellow Enzyme family)